MKEMLRPFDELSLPDADSITQRMFGCSCRDILQRILDNPLRQGSGDSAGEVAYQDGDLMGFQAAIARRLYWNGQPLIGIVGSTLGMRPEASPVLLLHLMKQTIAPRANRKFYFANTSNPQSMRMNKMLGIDGEGPVSCASIRFAITYWPRCLRWMLPEPSARKIGINVKEINVFWNRYLATSSGLVSSRSGNEMEWLFGDRIKDGSVVMLGDYEGDELNGWVVFKYTHQGQRAMLMDLIALENSSIVIARLLTSAVRFLRKHSQVVMLESIGFNLNIQPVFAKLLPYVRKTANNSFIFKVLDAELAKTMVPDLSNDWFWGPYDGDRCMG